MSTTLSAALPPSHLPEHLKNALCVTEAGDQVQAPTQICGVTEAPGAWGSASTPHAHSTGFSVMVDLQHAQMRIYSEPQRPKLKLKIFPSDKLSTFPLCKQLATFESHQFYK